MRLSGQREGGGGRGRGGRRLRSRAYGMDEGNQGHREAIGEREEGWGCVGCLGNSRELFDRCSRTTCTRFAR